MTFNNFKIHHLIKYIFFWLLYFALFRLFFVLYNHNDIPKGGWPETCLAFFYGLRLDLSMACLLVFVPFIINILQHFFYHERLNRIEHLYNYLTIIIVSLLSIANIKIFGEWGTLLNSRALKYLLYPKEALTFISFGQITLLLLLFLFFSFIGIFFYNKFIKNNPSPNGNPKKLVIELFVIPVFLFTAARGGIQLSPINESASYYSNIQVNNMIATNNIWYLAHSIVEAGEERNPYVYSDIKEAKKITAALFNISAEKTPNILNVPKPNIVFIVLESWTADIVKRLGGEENVTPHFDELSKDGLLFTEMYGSGFRTEQGLVSIFSGFPAQPNNSIITTPGKSEKLPSLSVDLANKGYHFSFYYGGEIEFANMKSYLLNSNFEKIIDKKDFRKDQLNSKWGAHDEFVFEKQLEGIKNEKEPFCSVILTLSSHEPFEVTMNTPFNGAEESERFKKAAYYSDNCLFKYFENAKKQAWYTNTIFILVADHGHRLPKNRDMNMPEGRRIAALITGGALIDSLRGKTVNKICNQNDIAATILEQLKMDHSRFVWSKDVFNPETKEFAYYSNENVLGWISPQQNIVFTYTTKLVNTIQPKTQKILNDTILTQAKSYLQTLYQAYLDY